jgi:hypothetical protein
MIAIMELASEFGGSERCLAFIAREVGFVDPEIDRGHERDARYHVLAFPFRALIECT